MSDRLCVVMPVYNEQDAIPTVLAKWDDALAALGIDYEIRPYNDGSKDGSLHVMHAVAAGRPRISVRNKQNGGHGNTILTGYREAAADGFDWIFQVPGVLRQHPTQLLSLLLYLHETTQLPSGL